MMYTAAPMIVMICATWPVVALAGGGQDPGKSAKIPIAATALEPNSAPFFQEVRTEDTKILKLLGQEITQKQDCTFYLKWTPEARDAAGNLVVAMRVIGVKLFVDIGGNRVEFDSTLPGGGANANKAFVPLVAALMNQDHAFTIRPANLEVLKIQRRGAPLPNVPAIKELIEATILGNGEDLRSTMLPWWGLPTAPGALDKGWMRKDRCDLGPIGGYDIQSTFTYTGVNAEQLDRIKLDLRILNVAPRQVANLPFSIKDASFKARTGSGEILYDPARGRTVASRVTLRLQGTVTIEVSSMAAEITLDQNVRMRMRCHDFNPLARK